MRLSQPRACADTRGIAARQSTTPEWHVLTGTKYRQPKSRLDACHRAGHAASLLSTRLPQSIHPAMTRCRVRRSPSLGVVPQHSISISTGHDGNDSVGRAYIRNPPAPLNLSLAVLERIRDATIGRNQARGCCPEYQPPLRVIPVDVKGTGENFLLIKQDIENQLPSQRL